MNLISIFSPLYVGIGLASRQCINYPLPPPSPSDSQSLWDRLERDLITDKYYGETRLPVHVCVSNTQTAKLYQKYPNKFTCTLKVNILKLNSLNQMQIILTRVLIDDIWLFLVELRKESATKLSSLYFDSYV